MPRNLSVAMDAAIHAQETGEVPLLLLTLTHEDLGMTLRFVNNTANITSRGNVYTAFPFKIALPEEQEDRLPRVTIEIDNVERTLVQTIRTLATPPSLTLELILASSPDTVEAGPFAFTLRAVEYDAFTIRGELGYEDMLNEAFPAHRFTPNWFPGLF